MLFYLYFSLFQNVFSVSKTGGGNQDKKNYFLNSTFFPAFIPGEKNSGNAPQSENAEASFLISASQDWCKYLIKMKFKIDASKPFFFFPA